MAEKIHAIAWYTLLENLRSRTLYGVALLLLLALCGAQFLSALAIIETREFQTAFLGVLLRGSAVVLLSLAVVTGMARELTEKRLELVLACALGRGHYLAGKFLGYGWLALLVAGLLALPLWFYAPSLQVSIWLLSLCCELLLVVGLALVCVLSLGHTVMAMLAVFACYVLARSMHALQLLGQALPADGDAASPALLSSLLDLIAFFLPGLDYFAVTDWLVYHTAGAASLTPVLLQTLIYIPLLAAAALFDLHRRNF